MPVDPMNQPTIPNEPDNQDSELSRETEPMRAQRPNPEDDVPFRLPKAGDNPDGDADETGDMPAVDDPAPGGKKYTPANMPTMPVYQYPQRGTGDPGGPTLPGSGGLDPNPDMQKTSPRPPDRPRAEPTMQSPRVQSLPTYPPQGNQTPAPSQYQQPYQNQYQRPPNVVPTGQTPAPAGYGQQTQAGYPAPPAHGQQGYTQALPNGKRKRRRKIFGLPAGCLYVFLGSIVSFCGGFTLLALVLGGWGASRVNALVEERLARLEGYRNFESTILYDRDGQQLYEVFNEGRRNNVAYEEFPDYLIDATIAIEDDTFWSNAGVEFEATARAGLQYLNLIPGSTGGSTITQQVVRNVLFDYEYRLERSLQRKIEEIVLALAITGQRSKEEILAMYLNEIYYGNLAYGAQAAAQAFFNKDVRDLTLGEAALLAGLPQAPADLDPLNPDPEVQAAVDLRWRTVLDRMVTEGFITDAERDAAIAEGLRFDPQDIPLNAPHFTVYAQDEFTDLMGSLGYDPEIIVRGGWQVYTTVDLDINTMATQIAAEQVAGLAGRNVSNAAVIVLQPDTGQILAMVGSIDYTNDAIDGRVNVTTAVRQPGSTMKLFTYASALELGLLTPGSVIWDTPTTMRPEYPEGQPPRNYDGAFHGPMTMRTALANSYNIPALQAVRLVGVEYYLNYLQRLGITTLNADPSAYGISLTLGGGEVALLELARAYGVFANQGNYVETTSILCILDRDGSIIYQYENGCPMGTQTPTTHNRTRSPLPVVDERIAFIMNDILSDNPARALAIGTNSPLYTPGLVSSVKTGTTNDVKDNWTVGYTNNVVVGAWVGNNNGDPMVNTSGLIGAAPIWNAVMTSIYANPEFINEFAVDGMLDADEWSPPGGVSMAEMCNPRAMRDPALDCPRMNEWMLDYPAGIPDGLGGFTYPEAAPVYAGSQSGPQLQEIGQGTGVYAVTVMPLPPEVSAMIQFPSQGGQATPPSPIYCQVPVELIPSAAGARDQYFLAPPPNPDDAARAEQWARSAGIPFLPTIACTADLLVAPSYGGGNAYSANVSAQITYPANGGTVSGPFQVLGTATFTNDVVRFYKIEIMGGQWSNWVTVGTTHEAPVLNGVLEQLPALPPGQYQLRLWLQSAINDDPALQPYTISFTAQ